MFGDNIRTSNPQLHLNFTSDNLTTFATITLHFRNKNSHWNYHLITDRNKTIRHHLSHDVARRRPRDRKTASCYFVRRSAPRLNTYPPQLIHHTIENFNIGPDKHAVSRVNESLSTLNQARDLRIKDAETALRKLSRQLSTMQSQHAELTSQHRSSDHANSISQLDSQKFRIAKAASDLEMDTERLSSQAADLSARLTELELQGVEGGEDGAGGSVEDEVVLRLKVYRSLGIEVERDGKQGEFSRAVVRSDRKGDVHVVNLDKKFSRFFYADYFWQTL